MNWLKERVSGQFNMVSSGALSLGIVTVIIAVVALVLIQVQSTGWGITILSSQFNSSMTSGLSAGKTVSDFLPVLAIVLVLAIIVGTLGLVGARKR